jgi:hypothetical protein
MIYILLSVCTPYIVWLDVVLISTRFINKKLLANCHLVEIDILKGKQHFIIYGQSCIQRSPLRQGENDWLRQMTTYIRWVNPDFQLWYAIIQVLLLQWGILMELKRIILIDFMVILTHDEITFLVCCKIFHVYLSH